MDAVLRIYDGSGANYIGDGGILHKIKNDMKKYRYVDEDSYRVDLFTSEFVNPKKYDISADDTWRLTSLSGVLMGSGRVMQEPATDIGTSDLVGEGWNSIFKDRELNNDFAASVITAEDILDYILDTVYSDYTFDKTGIATPSNTFNGREIKGQYCLDVIAWCCNNSRGANDRSFAFRAFEDPASLGTIEITFAERETAAALSTIQPKHIRFGGFNLKKRTDLNASKVVIYGATENFNPCPSDRDIWTEQPDNAAYQAFWLASGVDAGAQVNADGTAIVGSSSVLLNIDSGEGTSATLFCNLDDADAFDTDKTPTSLFTSGSGFKINRDKDQWLTCYMRIDAGLRNEINAGDMRVLWSLIEVDATATIALGLNELAFQLASNAESSIWYRHDIELAKVWPTTSHGIAQTGSFVSGLAWGVGVLDGTTDGNETVRVDSLHFYERTGEVFGSFDSGASNEKVKIIRDRRVDADWLADDVAEAYQKAQFSQYIGGIDLQIPIDTLYTNGAVNVRYPQQGVRVDSLPIQRIIRVPYNQHVDVGRKKTTEELIADSLGEIRSGKSA